MAIAVMEWVLEEAPELPGHCFAVLMALASKAREDGTCAYPSQEWLAERARKTDRSVRADLATLEGLGLIRRGDQGVVAHLVGDERPVVWDLAIERKQTSGPDVSDQGDYEKGRKPTSGRKSASARTEDATTQASDQEEHKRARKPTSGRKSTSGRKPASADTSQQAKPNSPPSGESARPHASSDSGPTPSTEKPKRGTRIPEDFADKITPQMVEWARRECPDVDGRTETKIFVDHWLSASGKNATKVDWCRAWQVWLRREQSWAAKRGSRASPRDGRFAPGSGPVPPPRHESLSDDPEDW